MLLWAVRYVGGSSKFQQATVKLEEPSVELTLDSSTPNVHVFAVTAMVSLNISLLNAAIKLGHLVHFVSNVLPSFPQCVSETLVLDQLDYGLIQDSSLIGLSIPFRLGA